MRNEKNDLSGYVPSALVIVVLLLVWPLAAWSHAHPEQRTPAPDAVLQQAPVTVKIVFSEELESAFSTLQVIAADGQDVTSADSEVVADNPRVLQVALQSLAVGTYTVKWHVVSRDGHTTEGLYQFTIEP